MDAVREHDLQGEKEAVNVLREMGADIVREGDTLTVRGGRPLHAVTRDGDSFTGQNAGAMGALDGENGKVDGNKLTWTMNMKVPMPMTLEAEATIDGDTLTVTIDRPEKRNALTADGYHGIKRAAMIVADEPALNFLVITGAGDVFCAGGDIRFFHQAAQAEPLARARWMVGEL